MRRLVEEVDTRDWRRRLWHLRKRQRNFAKVLSWRRGMDQGESPQPTTPGVALCPQCGPTWHCGLAADEI